MIAGRLNKLVTVEHCRETDDNSLGEETARYIDRFSIRADVVWGQGRREVDLEIVYSYNVTFIVWLYLYDRIKEGDFLIYAGKSYRVVSMEPVPEQRMLYLRAVTA